MNEVSQRVGKFQGVIFDLDGTLLDTLTDIAHAANSVLTHFEFPTHPVSSYCHFVGDGVMTLFQRALPAEAVETSVLDRCREQFQIEYAARWNVDAKPYAGITKLLNQLTSMQLNMAVLSNKPHEFTKLCVAELLSEWKFHPVLGERTGVPIKPHPQGAMEIAMHWQIPCENCLYVGDTGVDMQTACQAKMFAVGVEWGFRDRAELIAAGAQQVIAHPEELLSILAE